MKSREFGRTLRLTGSVVNSLSSTALHQLLPRFMLVDFFPVSPPLKARANIGQLADQCGRRHFASSELPGLSTYYGILTPDSYQ